MTDISSNKKIIMYSTNWCSDCARAKYFFDEYGIEYENIDIDIQEESVEIVLKINKGNRTVPTIIFPDGDVLVEPSYQQLADKVGVEL